MIITIKPSYMLRARLFICLITILFTNAQAFSQMQPFVAPKSADGLSNPLKSNAEAAAEGGKIYTMYCTPCHGVKGKGDGVAAAGLSKTPADHTSVAVQKQTDGAIFWKISEGNDPMPGYKKIFTETQIWQLVDYIRTLSKTAKK